MKPEVVRLTFKGELSKWPKKTRPCRTSGRWLGTVDFDNGAFPDPVFSKRDWRSCHLPLDTMWKGAERLKLSFTSWARLCRNQESCEAVVQNELAVSVPAVWLDDLPYANVD